MEVFFLHVVLPLPLLKAGLHLAVLPLVAEGRQTLPYLNMFLIIDIIMKLDGVGPVHNRPSTNKLHHFV